MIGVGKEVMRVVEWHHSSNGSKAIPIHSIQASTLDCSATSSGRDGPTFRPTPTKQWSTCAACGLFLGFLFYHTIERKNVQKLFILLKQISI